MRGAEPSALAGPPASYPPVTCVRRKKNKVPMLGPSPGLGVMGMWGPDKGDQHTWREIPVSGPSGKVMVSLSFVGGKVGW